MDEQQAQQAQQAANDYSKFQVYNVLLEEDGAEAVVFSPSGNKIALASEGAAATVTTIKSEKRQLLQVEGGSEMGEHIFSLSWSPNSQKVVGGGEMGFAWIWNASTGQQLLEIQKDQNDVRSVVWSPDGTRIILGLYNDGSAENIDETLYIINADTGSEIMTIGAGSVLSVALSPDGTRIASASTTNEIHVWDAKTGAKVAQLTGHQNLVNSVAFHPNGMLLVSGSADTTVRIWNIATQSEVRELVGHEGHVNSVAWSPDGSCVVSGSSDSTVRFWNAETGQIVNILRQAPGLVAWGPVTSVSFSPGGARLAFGCNSGIMLSRQAHVARSRIRRNAAPRRRPAPAGPDLSWMDFNQLATLETINVKTKDVDDVFDVIMAENVPIATALEDPDNVVFGLYTDDGDGGKLKTTVSYPREQLEKDTLGAKAFFYECTGQNTGLSVRFDQINTQEPYIKIAGGGNYYVKAEQIAAFFRSGAKIFAIDLDHVIHRPAFTTAVDNVQLGRGLNWKNEQINVVSSDHCQGGTQKIVYPVRLVNLL